MGQNKNALIRYKTLDSCLRNTGRVYYIEDLINECNEVLLDLDPKMEPVKLRQIQYDLKFMESEAGYNIPLVRVSDGKRRKYYRYSDPKFSITNQPLNQIEAEQLKSVLNLLSRVKGIPQYEWITDMIYKLKETYRLNEVSDSIISNDNNEYLKGKEYIGQLYDIILTEKVSEITYKSFQSDENQIILFHPYQLKEFNSRWYVIGKNDDYDSLVNLALDRIVSLDTSTIELDVSQKVNFEEYFDDIIGITKTNEKPIKVIIKVHPSQINYIRTKPWHHSFTVVDKDVNNFHFSIEVIPNYELETLIMSFGESVEVLQPLFLRTKLRKRVQKLQDAYK
jgi:predicted DNA-binding transcriptional regulator YafY